MTRLEAYEALLQGKKVRHNYYSSNEWLMYDKLQGKLITEDGCKHGGFMGAFWTKYQIWEDGWAIVE